MALVVVLAVIVLVSAVGISFFVHVTANRKIEASRANRMKTDLLAQSAGNYVIGQFLQEITGTSASTASTVGTVTVYQPLTQANAVPKRSVSAAIPLADTNFSNLVRQSVSQADVSADSSTLASQNGRLLSIARWNTPLMLSGSGFTSTAQLPNWIYIHRLNGATATSSTEVIGRFAYNVYDNGGLLDANVAGFPGVTGSAAVAQLKATVAGADLTQLGISQDAIDKLVSFRNATAVTSATAFSNWVSVSATSGFLFPLGGSGVSGTVADSAFLTRQDLLRYVRTQNTALEGALPYLTHFSRTLNAPSWGPAADAATGFAYLSDANLTTGTNRFLANVRFLTSGTVSHYADDGSVSTSSVSVGDCLLQRRFSLAKLAWLTHNGPLTGISDDAIKSCFGLKWDSSGKQWQYVANTSTLQSSIKTLGDVAKELREPNFFELLQAGILRGSLGKCGYTVSSGRYGYSRGGINGYDRNTTLHVARIAANIIDQYDTDSYPTAISIGDSAGLPLRICGIEDLPYFNEIAPIFYWPNGPNPYVAVSASNIGAPPFYNYLAYGLWNPHQVADSSARPTQFRVRIVPGATCQFYYRTGTNGVGAGYTNVYPLGDSTTQLSLADAENANLVFSVDATSSDPQQSYREPRLIRTGVGTRIKADFNNPPDVVKLLKVTDPNLIPHAVKDGCPLVYTSIYFCITRGVFSLDYLDEDGTTYRPYTTFLGQEEVPLSGWGGSVGEGGWMACSDPIYYPEGMMQTVRKIDPRSYRFDVSETNDHPERSLRPDNAFSTGTKGWPCDYPEFFGNQYTWGNPAPIGLLARNKAGSDPAYPVSYPDADGITRPADGFHGDCNPYLLNDATARPKILNRPFQSVAELGYVFRDIPFKTLDFFSNQSPDAALLDMFSIRDEPRIVAGQVNLGTPNAPVLRSLLSGATSIADAGSETASFQSYLQTQAALSTKRPMTVADLPSYAFSSDTNGNTYCIKPNSEAPVRALAGPMQTRAWNLMIDVVTQSGKFPPLTTGTSPLSGSQFVVEGEKRYWVFVTIDRYTGKIVDQQWETVNE